jgi:hypothetical protein
MWTDNRVQKIYAATSEVMKEIVAPLPTSLKGLPVHVVLL